MAQMYFIALVAPEEINKQVVQWKQFMKEHYGCVVALRSPAHITLIPPGWMDEEKEVMLKKAIEDFSKQRQPVDIVVKDFAVFSPRVIYVNVLPNEQLNALQKDLVEFINNTGLLKLKPGAHSFHPHITIATRDLHKKAFYEAWDIFKEKKYNTAWKADRVSLLKHNNRNWEILK